MQTKTIQIVDHGRGPQLSTTRITVLDVFYYLHRGYDFDAIHDIMPTLSRAEFDVVLAYVKLHHEELVDKDRRAEEFIQRGLQAQRAHGGIFAERNEDATTAERVARIRDIMKRRIAEKNGEGQKEKP